MTVASTAAAPAPRRWHDGALPHLALVLAVALAVRLALLPYASQDTLDHTVRIWIGWRWAEDPFPLLHGMWPPLQFFLIGGIVRLFGDPILAPVLLHVAIGSAIPLVLYLFTAREFGSRGAALAVGLAYALYPVAIRNSLEALAQAPMMLLLALTLLALSRARDPDAGWRHAAAAGLALTLAALLRYEGWMLIPFFALALWPRLGAMAAFVAAAALGPLASLAANLLHYGDALAGIQAVTRYELGAMGKADLSLLQRAGQVARLGLNLAAGMTPLLALLAALGALACLARRTRQAVWLIPPAGLLLVILAAAAQGSVNPKSHYTETFGLLLIPFLAAFLLQRPVRRLRPAGLAGVHAVLFGSMAFLLVIGTLRDLPGMKERSAVVRATPAVGPAPTFEGREVLDRVVPALRLSLAGGDGLVSDFLGYGATGYLALQSRRHPDRVWIAPVAPNTDLDRQKAEYLGPLRTRPQPLVGSYHAELDEGLRANRSGVLLVQPGSRFSDWLRRPGPGRGSLLGVELALRELARVPWPLPEDSRLRGDRVPAEAPGELLVLRYTVTPAIARNY